MTGLVVVLMMMMAERRCLMQEAVSSWMRVGVRPSSMRVEVRLKRKKVGQAMSTTRVGW